MKNDYDCLFSYIQEKRNVPQLSLLDWIHENPSPALEPQKDILKEYYDKDINFWVKLKLEVKHICLRSVFLVTNYALPKKEEPQKEEPPKETLFSDDELPTIGFLGEKTLYYHWCSICRYEYSCPIPNPHVYACDSCWDELEGEV